VIVRQSLDYGALKLPQPWANWKLEISEAALPDVYMRPFL
jgi:hypothetical protein